MSPDPNAFLQSKAKHELEEARLRLDATLGSADIGTWTWDIPANEVSADKNLARLFSIPEGKGPVENFIRSIHPDDQAKVQEAITSALKSKDGALEIDYRLVQKDESLRWVIARGKVQFDKQGHPIQLPGVIMDITDRKKQEESILELTRKMEIQTRLFDATLSNISDLAYTFDQNARVTYANKALLEIWGTTLEQAVGKNCFDLNYPPELGVKINGELLQVIATGKPVRGESAFPSASGVIDYHEYIFNPVFSADNKVVAVAGTTRLVTKRRKAEELARKSEEQLRLALSAANLGDWQWDPETDLITLSDRAAEIFGIKPGDVMTRTELRESINPEFRDQARTAAQVAREQGSDYDIEYKITRPDGTQCWVAAKGRNLCDEDGKIVSTLGVVQDITEQKKAGAANQYLAAIVESSEDAIISKNLDGVITSWNAGAERLFGYKSEEVVGKSVTLLMPPEEMKEEPKILERIRSGSHIDHYETIRLHKDGTLIDVSLTVSPIKDANDRIIGASKIARNITDQKKMDAELRRRERLYRAIGDSINYGIWVCDKEGRNIYASPSFLKLVGMTQEECSEFGWGRILHPDEKDATLAAWKKASSEGSFWEREHRCKGVDGKWHPILARGVPVHDDDGKIVSWVGINLDIQAFKTAEEKLQQARAQLQGHARELEDRVEKRTAELKETNSQLETLVYSIAHDLRAPLRSMQAYAKMLLEDYSPVLDETAQHYATRIVHSSETMDALVLDLLAYGRIARSEMQLEPIHLESAWQSALAQYEKDIGEKQARIETVSPLPVVLGNEVTLIQVLANLLGNALKFTAPGVFPVIRFYTETNGDRIRLWVEDNGIGISPEYHERIFRVFERLQGQAYPGTGIGLSIVRKGIERMGGKSGLESKENQGSRFWIELPRA